MTIRAERPAKRREFPRGLVRPPFVAGTFYPADPVRLRTLVDGLVRAAAAGAAIPGGLSAATSPVGLLVPHAGLVYSGVVAAAAWRTLGSGSATPASAPTVVVLGTNHSAGWLDGIGAWPDGAWRTPLGDVEVDGDLAAAIIGLNRPFLHEPEAHMAEHSIEVQLPILKVVAPAARIVPLAVATGTGSTAVAAGEMLGRLIAARRARGDDIRLAVSSDMAHYPADDVCRRVTEGLLPAILACDPERLAWDEQEIRRRGDASVLCGMCGIEPAVVGLAALRAMGTGTPQVVGHATSADAGADPGRTVGYLSVVWPAR